MEGSSFGVQVFLRHSIIIRYNKYTVSRDNMDQLNDLCLLFFLTNTFKISRSATGLRKDGTIRGISSCFYMTV